MMDQIKKLQIEQHVEETYEKRQLGGIPQLLLQVIAISTSVFHLLASSIFIFDPMVSRGATLLLGSLMAFLLYKGTKLSSKHSPSLLDYCLCASALGLHVYIISAYKSLIYRTGVNPTVLDLIFGSVMIATVLEMTRRTVGWVLTIFAGAGIMYALYGGFLPGILAHPQYSFARTVSYLFGLDSVYGVTLGVVTTYVVLFIIFGAFMQASGTSQFIVELSNALAGRARGGPAKVAVVASALTGTISGSTIANVVTTGSFTIPMMKSLGYKPHFAAAVETAASSGGQIMPPVMGAGAFIMAELLGIPYFKIMIAAAIPALLYFTSIFWQVDLEAQKEKLTGLSAQEIPNLKKLLLSKGHLLIPLVVLVWALVGEHMSAQGAGILAIVSCVAVSWVRKDTRMGYKQILWALQKAGADSIMPIAATAAAGIVVGVLSLTGLGVNLGISLLTFTGENTLLTLALTGIFAILLGCGQPSIAAYIIGAAVAAPSLIKLGIPSLTAHLFVFYFASFSNVTPPVAVASYVAAGIARAKPLATAGRGFILSIAAFLVPFLMVYRPGILLRGNGIETLVDTLTSIVGILALGCAVEGWLVTKLSWAERLAVLVAAALSLVPGTLGDILGAGIFFGILAFRLFRRRLTTL